MVVIDHNIPKSVFIPKEGETLFIDDDIRNVIDVSQNTHADVVKADNIDWYRNAAHYVKEKNRPEKPKDGKDYELDHKNPRWRGGNDSKENLQWVDKDKHKNKTKDEGSFQEGGNKRHRKLKENKDEYKEYQKGCGEKRQEKLRKELGEKGYSKQQSEIAKKRWNK